MREYADEIINGFVCSECNKFLDGDETGYPRLCKNCEKAERVKRWIEKK